MHLLKTIYQPQYVKLIEQLVNARKDLSLTQFQLATLLGKPQSYVAKVEGCERKLDVLEFIEWCKAVEQKASEYICQIEQHT